LQGIDAARESIPRRSSSTSTTASTSATEAGRALTRFIDNNGATIDILTIQGFDGRVAALIRLHLNKSKPSRSTRDSICNHLC
jgi:hypothetical protein